MIDAPLALAFTLGMLATVNPCGFAMLPAYLSFFLGVDQSTATTRDTRVNVGRSLVVGASVAAGFCATFAVIGLTVSHISSKAYDVAPWISLAIGVVLVGLGIALLAGAHVSVRIPRLDRGGRTRGTGSMVLFGVSYAVASLGCTLPLLLNYLGLNFGRGLASGVAFFVAYSAGFAVVLTALTVSIALTRQWLLRTLRRVLPVVDRVAGGLLVLTGAYVAYYGAYEIRTRRRVSADGIVDRVTGWSSQVSTWVEDTGGTRIGLFLAVVVAAAGVFVATRKARATR